MLNPLNIAIFYAYFWLSSTNGMQISTGRLLAAMCARVEINMTC